jgi:hypothetical protein
MLSTNPASTETAPQRVSRNAPALLVFADDWGRHPSSCQHLIRRLLPQHTVYWVNTIGMRRPCWNRASLVRAAGKLRDWMVPRRQTASQAKHNNPHVLSPLMWPWCGTKLGRRLNRFSLDRRLSPILRQNREPVVAITMIPIVADLMGLLPVSGWVYYCVDDFSAWPGLDQRTIVEMEDRVVSRADVLISVSELLRDRLAERGCDSYLLTHGVDLDLWRASSNNQFEPHFQDLERPLILFWGSIDWQMDVGFLQRLSDDLERGTIALVGPQTDPDPQLFNIPRVVRLPAVPYNQLPRLAGQAAVLVMPYADLPGLRESQPLKLKEYLATDRPAVVRALPANLAWSDALDVVHTAEEFSAVVRQRIRTGLPESQAVARRRLVSEDWSNKAESFRRVVLNGLSTKTSGGKA